MRAKHTPHSLPAFPVYSSVFVSPNELILGGGGGSSRSGIKNKLRLYNVGNDRTLDLLDEVEVEDAPTSMAADTLTGTIICGINSSVEQLEKGLNENCRVYGVKDKKLSLINQKGTLSGDVEDYQKVTTLSSDGTLLAVAGRTDLSLLSYPSLTPVAQPVHVDRGEIYDATFSHTTLVIATTVNLLVYALPKTTDTPSQPPSSPTVTKSKKKGKQKEHTLPNLELLKTVELPDAVGGPGGSAFRAARYHPTDPHILYTAINTIPSRSRKSKSVPRQGYVCKWDTETWSVSRVRKVGEKGVTCFDVSADGKLLGYGSSDYTIGMLDAVTLSPLITILKAHEFPTTTLKFNPSSTLLVSGSPDNSIRVVGVPQSLGGSGSSWSVLFILFITLLVIFLAIVVQGYVVSGSVSLNPFM